MSQTKTTIINESGFYPFILGSKLPQVQEFKQWVTSDVPSPIRRTGGYIPVAPVSLEGYTERSDINRGQRPRIREYQSLTSAWKAVPYFSVW